MLKTLVTCIANSTLEVIKKDLISPAVDKVNLLEWTQAQNSLKLIQEDAQKELIRHREVEKRSKDLLERVYSLLKELGLSNDVSKEVEEFLGYH